MTFSPVNQSDTCQTWASLRTCMWKRAVRTLSSVSHSRCSNDGESWKWLGTGKLDGNGLLKKKKKQLWWSEKTGQMSLQLQHVFQVSTCIYAFLKVAESVYVLDRKDPFWSKPFIIYSSDLRWDFPD